VRLLGNAVEALIVNDEAKTQYLALANTVTRLYKAILPDDAANRFTPHRALFTVLAEKIRSLTPPADIAEVMGAVETLLDASIAAEGYEIYDLGEEHRIDLSQIDFEALKEHLRKDRNVLKPKNSEASSSANCTAWYVSIKRGWTASNNSRR